MAQLPAGDWLVGRGQPVAYKGDSTVRALRGWLAPDRAKLTRLLAADTLYCGASTRPFLTRLDCASSLTVVSEKVLAMPHAAREKGTLLRLIPMSFRGALCVTHCKSLWAVMATASRTLMVTLQENEVLSVRREAAVAWTTRAPTGFCPRLRLRDILLPRPNRTALYLNFYGPGVLWLEGA